MSEATGGEAAAALEEVRIVAGERLLGVVAFVSRARGDATDGPDVDLLVVVEVERLLAPTSRPDVLLDAPFDDEAVNDDERAAVQEGLDALDAGDVYTFEEVDKELGL